MTAVRRRKLTMFCGRHAALALLACFVMTFSGCEDRPTRDGIDQHAEQSRQSIDNVMVQNPSKHYNPLVVSDKIWAGNTATRMQRGLPLPPRYENPRGITLVSSEPMSLADIANAITEQTGISVRVSQVGTSSAPSGASSSGSTGPAVSGMPMAYEGPLSGLMERVAGYYGINWRYDGSSIAITRFETRVFTIEALQGNTRSEAQVQQASTGGSGGGGGGSSGGGGGGSGGQAIQGTLNQSAKYSIENKYWDELGQIVTSMLGGTGTVVVSPSMGSLTVTTTPEIMHTVAEYIAQQNQRLSRQIAINVEIYSVDLTNGMDFNIAFTAAIRKITSLATGISTGVSSPAEQTVSAFTGASTMNVAIIDPNGIGTFTDAFKALSAIGDTTKVAKFPMVTLNNIPVIRRIGQQVGYVSQAQTTITGTSGTAQSSLTGSQIQVGYTVAITPRILDDGRILLDYSLELIELNQIAQFNSQCGQTTSGSGGSCGSSTGSAAGSSTIELPNTTERAFAQQSVLKSGSTLIMGGAEEEDLQQNSQGVASPYNYFLGGGISSGKSHAMIFFAITPQVVDVPHSEQE